MIENSSAGLTMMAGEVTVTVTREEQHQPTLARYDVGVGGERHVAVELGWCTIRSGRFRGEHAIEVRLDGWRVGELTHLMSQRYGPLLGRVAARGGRPGCEAIVQRTARGLEIVLRLPRADATLLAAPAVPPAPAVALPSEQPKRGHKLAWTAAAVVAAIAFFAAIGSTADDSPSSTPAPGAATTTEPVPTTTEPAPTTTTTTTTTVAPKPKPRVTTPKPAPPPPATPKPKPAPDCDPNYTPCVPVASDVDCAGGSGNGPAYATGPVRVVGNDVYDLDRDGDGTACE